MGEKQNSRIIICKDIKMDREYKNVLRYSEQEMINLCTANQVNSANNYSFIDYSKNEILVGFSYGECLQSNYIAFENPYYHSKWFFAWIDKVEYRSDSATKITFTVDAWSTFYTSWNKKTCYVIREHVTNDAIGANTVNEDLAVQEVMVEDDGGLPIYSERGLDSDLYVAVATNWRPNSKTGFNGIVAYSKGVFGQNIHLFGLNDSGLYNLYHYLFIVGGQGHTEDIHDMFIVPASLIPAGSYTNITAVDTIAGSKTSASYLEMKYDSVNAYNAIEKEIYIDKLHSFSDYTPKNNKCFCYPYNYLYATNNVGSNNIYKYEDFYDENPNKCRFKLQLALSIGVSGRLLPMDYKNINSNCDESLPIAKYPTCGWSSDSFTNWLTQNAVNISQTAITGVASAVAGNAAGAVGAVSSLIGSFYKASLLPETTGGSTTADVNFAGNSQSPCLYRMRAKTEFMRIIDDYFTRYGYKILRNKLPNLSGRKYWNYIQIGQGESIGYGNVPVNYMDIINRACQNGVTIWHDHQYLGDYSLNNTIL